MSKRSNTMGTKRARRRMGAWKLKQRQDGLHRQYGDPAEVVRQREGGAEESVALPEFIHPHPMAVHIRLLFNLGRFEGINFFHNRRQK